MLRLTKETSFFELCNKVSDCTKCARMADSKKVLNLSSGNISSQIMFVGEAPGRLGADTTGIPFHGDRAGHNFEALLDVADISRELVFITNSVLCNPKDSKGNNATPNKMEIDNCSAYLAEQIALINPKVIVTLGATALSALSQIERHGLSLKEQVRTANDWNGRLLIPLYHPGQRAMIHRSFANQQSDYRFVADTLKKIGAKRVKRYGKLRRTVHDLVEYILYRSHEISYFSLHKIAYIVEYELSKKYDGRYTGAYFIRQKDGPYCTDLHIQKLKNSINNLRISSKQSKLYLSRPNGSLFDNTPSLAESDRGIDRDAMAIVDELVELPDTKLKTRSYLSKPMKEILKKEKAENHGAYNQPIEFDDW